MKIAKLELNQSITIGKDIVITALGHDYKHIVIGVKVPEDVKVKNPHTVMGFI